MRVSTENGMYSKMTRMEPHDVGGSVVILESSHRLKKNDRSDDTPNIDSMIVLEKVQNTSGGVKGSIYAARDSVKKQGSTTSNGSER